MKRGLAFLALLGTLRLFGAYTYDYVLNQFSMQDFSWGEYDISGFANFSGDIIIGQISGGNPSCNPSCNLYYGSPFTGYMLMLNQPVSGNPNDYEINTTLVARSAGAVYRHILRANANLTTYIDVELLLPANYQSWGRRWLN